MKTGTAYDREFDKSATGRLRILRKQPTDESVIWSGRDCTGDIYSDR